MLYTRARSVLIAVTTLNLILLLSNCGIAKQNDNGLIITLEGKVSLYRSEGRSEAEEGASLQPGDTIRLFSGSSCAGITPAGESFSIQGPEHFIILSPPVKDENNGITAWFKKQLNDWIHPATNSAFISRSSNNEQFRVSLPVPLIPASGGKVRPYKSTFIWTLVDGVEKYKITVITEEGEEIVRMAHGNSLIIEKLEPGSEYAWKVEPHIKNWAATSRWREFKVLTDDELEKLNGTIKDVSDLQAAVTLLIVGLHAEALDYLDDAVEMKEYRGSALKWRAETYAEIGYFRKAYLDLKKFRKWKDK